MKLKSLSLSVLAALSLGVATSAMADEANTQSIDKSGWWIGAGVGMGIVDSGDVVPGSQSEGVSTKLEAGYDFNKNVGLYGSYDYMHDLGEADLHMGTLGVKGNYYFTENLSVFGKLGATYIFADEKSAGDQIRDLKTDSFSGTIGAGLEYQLTNAVSTKIGYDYYQNLEITDGKDTDLHQVYWGMTYKFGQPATPKVITEQVEVVKEVAVATEVPVATRSSYVLPYQTGQVKLNDYGRFNLNEVASTMRANPELTADIVGRTDSTGSQAVNDKVSKARAEAVAQYLVDNGVEASRLNVSAVANTNPLTDAEGKSLIERSVQIVLK
ncbi:MULTISPECIES: OmpA family protein [Photobacterium]|uniref:Membrane protein n=1 Tax=Photobacterium ganghwense TaxID=320778 RepID=A0A0J1HIT4_9GAMM|nr:MULTISPECIES: OmpA family protein [Photobacterium]KLV11505.1 membrane protein [Photobacterium ganghwense]MBV1842314.1 outer membrane beta-barrel protein [Photobacterium ganghwense]PSU08367.1 OmpA family protein [Photobacterium ganghwense]QSV15174.1 outer membrane beta-barrel protein [Photobacterium ganghwense]